MKRAIFGVVWAILLYFGACFLIGAGAGAIAGATANDPESASIAGAQAGAKAVAASRLCVFVAAAAVGGLGAWFRVLPGTRANADKQFRTHGSDTVVIPHRRVD